MMLIDLLIRSTWTCIVYTLSNYHTYQVGIKEGCNRPLKDIGHDMLPDWSHKVHIRDYILPLLFAPILFVSAPIELILQLWEGFLILITLKAITIFFTYCPPSNPDCHIKRYVNSCFHQMFSGHNSLSLLLFILYCKHTSWNRLLMFIPFFMYSLLILMTRAHYTVDIVVSYIITFLLVDF